MTQEEYYSNKASRDAWYGDRIHEATMSNLITDAEYKLFHLLKPNFRVDGDKWCVLLGENLQDGVAGFGDTLYLAILDFNKAFHEPITPQP